MQLATSKATGQIETQGLDNIATFSDALTATLGNLSNLLPGGENVFGA